MGNAADAFVVPHGLLLQITAAGLDITHEGDIVLHSTLGQPLHRVRSVRGNVSLFLDAEVDEIAAGGELLVEGDLRVRQLDAESVRISGALDAEAVQISGSLQVGGDARLGQVELGEDLKVDGRLVAKVAAVGGSARVGGTAELGQLTAIGDFSVEGNIQVDKIEISGDLTVGGDLKGDHLSVGGAVSLAGAVDATHIEATRVRFGGGPIQARGVQASESISVGAVQVQCDALIAPRVDLQPGTRGRVTVVESLNELGSSAIKGGLRLSDLAEMFGSSEAFLKERGLRPLSDGAKATEAAPAAAPSALAVEEDTGPQLEEATEPPLEELGEDNIQIEVEGLDTIEEEEPASRIATVQIGPNGSTPQGAWAGDGVPEHLETSAADQVEVEDGIDDEGDLDEVVGAEAGADAPSAVEDETYTRMVEVVGRITTCYPASDPPPALTRLHQLIEERNYDSIQSDLTDIWNQLLKYHQKRGLRIQPQVTTTFNTINAIVRKL